MGAARPLAVPVNHEGVLADRKPESLGDRVLTLLDSGIDELFDVTAVETQNVIVVRAGIELEHRHAVGKVVAGDKTRRLELSQHAIDRGESDVLTQVDQPTINVLRRQMTIGAVFKDLQDLDAWKRHLEPCFAQIVAFHDATRSFG